MSKKLVSTESELERAEERGELGETKIMELEEELKVVANNLKSLEVSEEKANAREIANKEQIKTLTSKLKQAEARAEFAEKSVAKLNQEVRLTIPLGKRLETKLPKLGTLAKQFFDHIRRAKFFEGEGCNPRFVECPIFLKLNSRLSILQSHECQ